MLFAFLHDARFIITDAVLLLVEAVTWKCNSAIARRYSY
jgi:hypothetical protein